MYFPIIDVLKENFTAKIPSIVTQWLTDNVDPVGSAVVVDESLSISGAAADAKITGDELNNLKSDLNKFKGDNPYTVKDNYYVDSSGAEASSGLYELYTVDVIEGKRVFGVTANSSNGTGYLAFYNANGQLIGSPFRNDVDDQIAFHFDVTAPTGATTLKITNRKAWSIPVTFATGEIAELAVEHNQRIASLEDVANTLSDSSSIDFSGGASGYVNYLGVMTSHNDYYHIDVNVNVGDTIVVDTYSISGAVSVFAKKSGSTYTPLVVADSNSRKKYSYTATEKMVLTVSYLNATKSGTVTLNASANSLELIIADYQSKITSASTASNYAEMFHTVGVIGDSLASGEIAYTDNGNNIYVDKYEYSWLSNICRNCGTTPKHYSKGGMMAKTWLEDNGGMRTAFANDNACNAYFIALGTNDMASDISLGLITDASGTNSFVGYMKQIIELVHTKAPHAVVFLVSTYANHSISHNWSNMISDIANLYSYCYYVDFLNNTDIYTTSDSPYTSLGHFTTPAYVGIGKTINELVNSIVDANYADFMLFAVNN